MKRTLLFVGAGLALLVGLAVATRPRSGRAQDNPAPFQGAPAAAAAPASQPPAAADINRDIEVTATQGPWMVCVASYTGKDAPQMARQLVTVLRGPRYKLPAYVFNRGAEERREQEARLQAYIQQQQQMLEQIRAQFRDADVGKVYRPATHRVQEQVAVLVGGYADMDAAHRELKRMRDLPVDGLRDVKLDQRVFIAPDGSRGEGHLVSPFRAAFVVHNPTVPQERPAEADKLDVAALRRLNDGETYNLLDCRKPLTLVVAQYWLPAPLEKRGKQGSSFLGKMGLGGKGQSDQDPAAVPARNVAEWLRKSCKLEAYVLHTKNASIVTVGGYDSLQDPHLRQMQERWVQANFPRDPRFQMLNLFPTAVPMQVPR
jgi:hypothetical protein